MTIKDLRKKINRRKRLLNFLLLFFKGTNPLIVNLSQNLDKFIVMEQKFLAKKRFVKKSTAIDKSPLKKAS